jgi:hypothetical protein
MEQHYKNLGYFLIVLVAFVVAGFYKPYFALIPNFDPSITPLVQVHAILLMSFVALLVGQPLLIRYKQRELHKSLGKLTYFLMPLLVASCVGVILKEYAEALSRSASVEAALRSIFSDVAQLVLLVFFYLLAILNRRNVSVHMRYMIAVALIVAPAGIARVLGYWFEVPRYASGLAIECAPRCRSDRTDPVRPAQSPQLPPLHAGAAAIPALARGVRALSKAGGAVLTSAELLPTDWRE